MLSPEPCRSRHYSTGAFRSLAPSRVQEYLANWGHRIVLHFLPKYAPETEGAAVAPKQTLHWTRASFLVLHGMMSLLRP
jgi:hypothetical protein